MGKLHGFFRFFGYEQIVVLAIKKFDVKCNFVVVGKQIFAHIHLVAHWLKYQVLGQVFGVLQYGDCFQSAHTGNNGTVAKGILNAILANKLTVVHLCICTVALRFGKAWGGNIHKDDILRFALLPCTKTNVAVVATYIAKCLYTWYCLHYFL